MIKIKVGDKVRISPTQTHAPWKGELIGRVYQIVNDGTVAVEVDSPKKLGHCCSCRGDGKAKNAWYFRPDELTVISEDN